MIVFVLRHADRNSPPPPPPDDLNAAGKKRAQLLARLLGESRVSVAYCSDANRAQRTLQPLKQKLGQALTVHTVPTANIGAHVQTIVNAVKALPGHTVAIVVTHSNTVGPIVQGLTNWGNPQIAEHEFDKLFVLSIPAAGAAHVTLLRYGEPTP